MILCFRCTRETKNLLDDLVASGRYSDYAEVIAFAVTNLAVLEDEMSSQRTLLVDTSSQPDNVDSRSNSQKRMRRSATKRELKRKTGSNAFRRSVKIPDVFRAIDRPLNPPHDLAKLPSDVWNVGQEVPLDRWIFGQYNRLLPAKASCRAIANLMQQNEDKLTLIDVAQAIAHEAALLGDYLRVHDSKKNIERDDLLAIAFPSSNDNNEKSRLRYANQFVGNFNKDGQLSGLLIDYKLVNRVDRQGIHIKLTEPGWHFAGLTNPVLDMEQDNPLQKFGDEEITFLLEHIKQHVPVEDYAFRTILATIEEGANTPDSIDAYLQNKIPLKNDHDLSESFLSTQRSGSISRMTDLGLVERIRQGVRVKYTATPMGYKYLRTSHLEPNYG